MRTLTKSLRKFQSPKYNFSQLRKYLEEYVPKKKEELAKINKDFGSKKMGEYTVSQVIGGMRGMKGIMSDISVCDPQDGILFKQHSINDLKANFPKAI